MSYELLHQPSFARGMKGLPADVLRRADIAVAALAANPRPQGCVKLKGHENLYRIRVGDYRIVYEIDDDARRVLLTTIAHRREVYRGM